MLESKLPQVGTTIFTVMSQMAQEYGAINLSQGFPDFDCPARLRELVSHYLNAGKNQYAPMTGVVELREQIRAKIATLYGCEVDVNREITVTSGATEALFAAVHAVVRPGDEVILFDPAYDSYGPSVELAGGKTVHVALRAPDYSIDWNLVRDAITTKTRLIIINTPHNPTGAVWSSDDMLALTEITRDKNLFILADEVYEHMVFDGCKHESVLSYPELMAKSFAVFSFGKTYHATGWKIAYCVAPAALSVEFRKVHQFLTFTTCSFIQYALADFMRESPEHYLELAAFYQSKRDRFCQLLTESRFSPLPSKGTYFQLLDYSELSPKADVEYATWLTQHRGIASVPLSVFYKNPPADKVLRFCFCKDDQTLTRAAEILCSL